MAYWVTGSYTPFDDSLKAPTKVPVDTSKIPIDTRAYDQLRQGVEITHPKFLFAGTQPKILGGGGPDRFGRMHHFNNEIEQYGTAVSFTDFFGTAAWEELPKFDPVVYVMDRLGYPYPIMFNNGPQQAQEAIIEPLTIPFRLSSNEGRMIAHKVTGEYEDGNALDDPYTKSSSQIENYIDINNTPLITRPFLDSGEERFGNSISGSVYRDGYVSTAQRLMVPFLDQEDQDRIIPSISGSVAMKAALRQLDFSTNDILQPVGKKPSNSGFVNYGRNAAKYGTDSIAYSGWTRGS